MELAGVRHRHRPRLAAVLCLCLTFSVAACSDENTGLRPTADRVTAAILPFLTMAPFHIAAEEGYFAEQNLEVEFIKLSRQQELMAALVRGEVDVTAGMVSVHTLNSMAGGARMRFVAALGELAPEHCPFNAFVARRELVESGAFHDPERVRGMRFDVEIVLPFGYWTDVLLEPLGLTIDDIEVISLPEAAGVEALINGSIDVAGVSEPFLGLAAASDEAVIWRETGDLVPEFLISVMSYSASLLDERPEVGERFATAMLAAIRQFRSGKTPRNLALVESFTGLSPDQVATACWPTGPDDARVNVENFRGYQEWTVSRGYLDRVLSADELVDHRFMNAANVRLAR